MIYNFEEINKLNKHFKKWLIIVIVISLITIGTYIGLGFVLNDSNKIWMQILLTFLLALIGCFVIYIIYNKLLKDKHRIFFLTFIRRSGFVDGSYKVIGIEKEITISKDITCLQIRVFSIEGEQIFYWPPEIPCDLKIGEQYKFVTGNGHIIDYEQQ